MTTSNLARVPAEFWRRKELIANGGAQGLVQGPMSQQDAADCHGHDMHPQKHVRLLGSIECGMAGSRIPPAPAARAATLSAAPCVDGARTKIDAADVQPSWLICSSVTTRSTFSVSHLIR